MRTDRPDSEAGAIADESQPSTQGTRIRSVSRAARLLLLVASLPEGERTINNLAGRLKTSVPTVYHLVNTLMDAQLLTRDEQRNFHLGAGIGALAVAYEQQTAPPAELIVPLQRIVDATGENAYFSAWRHGNPVVLATLAGTHSVQVANLRPGFQSSAHARASGKVLLAFSTAQERERYFSLNPLAALTPNTITDLNVLMEELDRVESAGYATEHQEFAKGVACISVPIWNMGILVGTYTISAPVERYRENQKAYLQCLLENSASVSSDSDDEPQP